jgi:predicted dehydrogenase
MANDEQLDRRGFLKQAAAAGAAAAWSARPALGKADANDRVGVGVIGCGAMGTTHLEALTALREKHWVDIVAVSDVFDKRLDAAKARTGAEAFRDYRKLLDRKDVDAVVIATPDHWHASMSIAAAEAGKDVYCEKPMTHWKDLQEAKDVVAAIARNKRVMQVGTNGLSDSQFEQAAEQIAAKTLGKLIRAQASDQRNGPIAVYSPKTNDPQAEPGKTLDWDQWLGPAPKHAYEPGRYFAFRSFWDYSGGIATDFFPHMLTPLVAVMDLGFPKRAAASGGLYYWNDGREVPDVFDLMLEYPAGPTIHLAGGLANDSNFPMQIQGQRATLTFGGSGFAIDPQFSADSHAKRAEVKTTRPGSLDEHWRDFLTAVHTRKKPRAHELHGYHVMAALHMGVRSFREGKVFEFDAEKEEARAV